MLKASFWSMAVIVFVEFIEFIGFVEFIKLIQSLFLNQPVNEST